MSGTHLYYNGVLFRDCETLDYSCVLEFDESGTHERFLRTRITVASTLVSLYTKSSTPLTDVEQHPSTILIPPTDIADETTPARIEEIKRLLSEPRKDFWYAINGVIEPGASTTPTAVTDIPREDRAGNSRYRLILVATGILPTSTPAAEEGDPPVISGEYVQMFDNDLTVKRVDVLDANNGPKPSDFGFKKIIGGNVVRVQATFEVCRVLSKPYPDADNPEPFYDAQKVRGVVSNSWSCVDALDDDGAVSHTINGKMVVKDKRYKANAMRLFSFPLPFPYARLTNRQHTVDHSGLVLEYQYTFKHAGAAPPQGVRKFEATYTEMAGPAAAGLYRASMSIKVQGWHDRSDNATPVKERERKQKLLLMRGAETILQSRMTAVNRLWLPLPGQNAKTRIVTDFRVIERVGLPELELQIAISYGESNKTEFYCRLENMGKPLNIPSYDPRWWPVDNEWGRLPRGNGHASNDGDNDNPNFDNAAYPYATQGTPGGSDYFTGYFQSNGSNRHTLPRITGHTNYSVDDDTSKEWARSGGSIPEGATEAESSSPETTRNPISGNVFEAVESVNLVGSVVIGPLPPVEDDSFTGVADVQGSGFHYITWSSEVMNDSAQGKIMLPLSRPRDIAQARRKALLGLGSGEDGAGTTGKECSVAVSLCAPKSTRVYSWSATRSQKWAQGPEPKQQIVRAMGEGSTQHIANIETLISKEFLGETPVLQSDGITRLFTCHGRYTYGLSNPWAGSTEEGGGGDFETLPIGESPVDKSTASQNAIVVRGGVETLSPLFDATQYA